MSRRLQRLPGRGLRVALAPLNRLLGALEGAVARGGGDEPLPHPPLFILGAPRCGSTLLYQALVETGTFGYLSNLHCLFYGSPALVHRWSRRLAAPPESRFRSSYGRVRGLGAPAECGEFWYRFFRRRPQHVVAGELGPAALGRLRGAVRRLIAVMDRPLLIKNLLSSVRLRPLAEALPEALFVVLRRDETDNAISLLEARRRLHGSCERWFSVEPPAIDELRRLPAAAQVVEQVRAIYRLIGEDRRAIGGGRFTDLSYEELCRDSHAALGGLAGFLAERGIALGSPERLPARFPRRRQGDSELRAAVERYADAGRGGRPTAAPELTV